MQILNKKSILNITTTQNYLETYKYYLKDLNFFNKFKNKNKTLLKDVILFKLNELYLLNINLKENYFFSNIQDNNLYQKNKNNLIYFIKNHKKHMINDMVIDYKIINSFFYKFYLNFLLKKIYKKKYKIIKFKVKNNLTNNIIKLNYKKKIKINLPYIKSHVIKIYKKKYCLITFCGLIFKMKSKNLYINNIKKKNIYNSYLKKRFKLKQKFQIKFKKLKQKTQYFYYKNKLKKNKLKFNFSRIFLIKDLKKKKTLELNNLEFSNKKLKNLKKFSFFLI